MNNMYVSTDYWVHKSFLISLPYVRHCLTQSHHLNRWPGVRLHRFQKSVLEANGSSDVEYERYVA